ncbi:hypothetical protein K523DRAFT_413669 [Schizophyllum commune Tattone D]|nr:hypothetical protein K523DRAFT_413669 [Schizophyllum commune Tattone D]
MSSQGVACRMARTCRAWHQPALDRIWRENRWADALDVLLRILPSDLYHPLSFESTSYGGVSPKWFRGPTSAEYERIYQFSSRMQSLENPGYIEVFQITMTHPPPRPLFPRLRILRINGSGSRVSPHMLLEPFASPVLTRLDIFLPFRNQWMEICLNEIYSACAPSVKVHFDLRELTMIPRFVGNQTDMIHSVTMAGMCEEGWAYMAALPRLQELRVHDIGSAPRIDKVDSVKNPFHALQLLEFSSNFDCRPFVADLLGRCGRLSLSTLKVRVSLDTPERMAHPTDHWVDLFLAIERHCAHDTLRTLSLADDGEMARIGGGTLQLLAPFRELRTLSIENKNGVVVEDRHIAPLMRSWPALQSLRLVPSRFLNLDWENDEDTYASARYISTCTVPGLLEIARLGTALQSLTLTVDFENDLPPGDNDWPLGGDTAKLPCNTHVTMFDAWVSDMGNVCDVAGLLLAVFPAAAQNVWVSVLANKEHYEGSRDEVVAAKWEQVFTIIDMVRTAERNAEQRVRKEVQEEGKLTRR